MNRPVQRRVVRVAVASCLAVAASYPAAARAQTSPDSSKLATARQLLQLTRAADVMAEGLRAGIPAQQAANPRIPAEFWAEFQVRAERDAGQLLDSLVVLYASSFAQGDLDGLVAFYLSPIGRRVAEAQPMLAGQSTAIGQRWGMRLGAAVAASLEARGIHIQP